MPDSTTAYLKYQLHVANILGEGVIWDHRQQVLWWTDIHGQTLHSWTFSGDYQVFPCPQKLCSFGLSQDPQWFICAFASGFAWFNPYRQQVIWLHKLYDHQPAIRMNDGRVDRQGRFWAGSMVTVPVEGQLAGALYCLNPDGSVSQQLSDIEISNSLCWSPASELMYFADSPKRKIQRARFDSQSGQPGTMQDWLSTDPGAYPDGSCIDSQGCLWNAQWGSSSVKRYSPEGQLLFTLPLPCVQPTCVTFAGPKLNYLCVSSATEGLTNPAHNDGSLLIFDTNIVGLTEAICSMSVPAQP